MDVGYFCVTVSDFRKVLDIADVLLFSKQS